MKLRGAYKQDIGFDEIIENGRYTNIVSNEYGDVLAVVEGSSVEECDIKSKLVAMCPKMLELLNDIYAWAEQEQSAIGEPPFLYEIDKLLEKLKP